MVSREEIRRGRPEISKSGSGRRQISSAELQELLVINGLNASQVKVPGEGDRRIERLPGQAVS